jgi:hypothetical protein
LGLTIVQLCPVVRRIVPVDFDKVGTILKDIVVNEGYQFAFEGAIRAWIDNAATFSEPARLVEFMPIKAHGGATFCIVGKSLQDDSFAMDEFDWTM